MRLIQIKPFYFRAFTDPPPIFFNDNLTIFYGGNGTGKSSLAEALEWLFYGYTKRRKKGDEYSKNEYKGSYVNINCPRHTAPYVEAKVRLTDGSTHRIRRTIKLDKSGSALDHSSVLSFNGAKCHPHSSILSLSYTGAHCPVIVQHGIQDFIHTRPKDRYRLISEALGLSDLIEFKDALEKAKNFRRNNPLPEIREAKAIVTQLIKKLDFIGLTTVAERWKEENFSVDSDYAEILEKAHELSHSDKTIPEDILKDVRICQAEEKDRVFDINPFRLTPNFKKKIQQLSDLMQQIRDSDENYKKAAADYAGVSAAQYQTAQLIFWKQGLSLLSDENPEKCPFCEEPTITGDKIQSIKGRLEADKDLSQPHSTFTEETEQYISIISQIEKKLPELEFKEISNENLSKLEKLIKNDETRFKAFVDKNREGGNFLRNFHELLNQTKSSLSSLKRSITDPDKILESIKEVENIPSHIEKAYSELAAGLEQYDEAFNDFRPVFDRDVSDESTVAKFTNLIDVFNNYSSVRLMAEAKSFDSDIIDAQRDVDQYILDQQKLALEIRQEEIFEWYNLLSYNQGVKFSGLEPKHNEFNLQVEAFGKTMNAAASLSHSQLNCLGLSIHIPGILVPDSPFKFILFDDPVQAMDDDHHESFLLNVVPELMGKFDFQVIVLTHLKYTADRLRELNYKKNFTYYHFDTLDEMGPVIFENRVFIDDIIKIRELADGYNESRKLAVCRIRILCEEIMQEAYLRHTGSQIPGRKVTASQMIPHFSKVPPVTEEMVYDVKDTIKWANPSCHDAPGYIVPSSANIKPHINRLDKIIKTLKLNK
jgi:hypothetical protein